jgi:hypothetical protein
MLRRESQLRNAPETQQRLDELNHEQHTGWHAHGHNDNKRPETMEEAMTMIAALRAQLQRVVTLHSALQEETESLRDASCDKKVFEGIKARVVREFGLSSEYVDVLYSAVARFPGDADIVASANCELYPHSRPRASFSRGQSEPCAEFIADIKFNRAVQGTLEAGGTVPMDDITLASLDGHVASMREMLSANQRNRSLPAGDEELPVAIIAGSITWPPFKAACPWLIEQAAKWQGKVRFLVVYIAEAHASDEWPVGRLTSVTTQPKNLIHRRDLASVVHTELLDGEVEVVCDDMQNTFQRSMACWPIRLFVVDPTDGALLYKAQPDLSPDVYGYRLESLSEWLESAYGCPTWHEAKVHAELIE